MIERDLAGAGPALALVGAFPFPYPQGSQVFMADQARALARAGARPTLFTYGRGQGMEHSDLELAPAPRWTSPRVMRSGPQWGKPVADAALLSSYAIRAGGGFAFALAHNVEAALIALTARPLTGLRVIYVAHTILRHELSAYADPRWRGLLDEVGGCVERLITRFADGVITLADESKRELTPFARCPIAVIPPGHDPQEAPTPESLARICAQHDLRVGKFILYAGNLDRYQDLDLLAAAARRLPESAPPIVIATHDASNAPNAIPGLTESMRIVTVGDFEEMRTLIHAAQILVLTRRRPGGFPVKLLNYMEAARPIVAFENVAVGLRDDESARLLVPGSLDTDLALAMQTLAGDAVRSARLGAAARRHLIEHHGWDAIARRTLDYLSSLEPGW